MEIYTYSILNDFPNQVISATCLNAEIDASVIATEHNGIQINGDVVEIDFYDVLSAGDVIILDDIIENHNHDCYLEQEGEAIANSLETPLIVQEDEVDVLTITDTINFEGNVNVADDGNGRATVDILGAEHGNEGNNTTISFGDHQGPRLLESSSVYVVRAYIIYRGSNNIGIINKIKALAWVKDGAKPGDIKIYDVTNGNTIVEFTGIANELPAIIDLGTLSNMPVDEAVFEVHLRNIPGEIYFASLLLNF